ncbi:MAG TPA: helix-turn-helix domain-containing protein [Gammaproteobacteria bacterium]|nr:helix-turn-helix domain-containing protein [Gammaproteobacteria bacterium]
MDIHLKEKLEKAGLTENEALIYAYLLDVGGAYPSAIALGTKINRSTVYKALLQMNIKGLVSEIERSKKLFYQVTSSNALSLYARNQVKQAERSFDVAESLLPEIEKLVENAGYKPKVITFDGIEGVLKMYEDHISQEKPYEMVAIANADKLYKFFPKNFFERYRKTKEEKGITTRGIIPDTKENRAFVDRTYTSFGIAEKYWPVMKYIDPKLFSSDAEITIYGERRVSIARLTEKHPLGAIIDDEIVYEMFKMMFEVMWNSLPS